MVMKSRPQPAGYRAPALGNDQVLKAAKVLEQHTTLGM